MSVYENHIRSVDLPIPVYRKYIYPICVLMLRHLGGGGGGGGGRGSCSFGRASSLFHPVSFPAFPITPSNPEDSTLISWVLPRRSRTREDVPTFRDKAASQASCRD